MFKKSNYSDLEVQEILQTLFREKKRASELELKLKNSSPAISSSAIPVEEVEKLRNELDMVRFKLRESTEAHAKVIEVHAKDRAALIEQSQAPSPPPQEAQFENIIKFLRKKSEDVQAENHLLVKKINAHEETFNLMRAELQKAEEARKKLLHVIETEQQVKTEILAEEEALKSQAQQLKTQLASAQAAFKTNEDEKLSLGKKLQEVENAYLHSQQELELLKQMMLKSMQEFKDERSQEKEALEKQVLHLNKLTQELQQQLIEQNKINNVLKDKQQEQTNIIAENSARADSHSMAHRELAQFTEDLKHKLLNEEQQKFKAQTIALEKEGIASSLQTQVDQLTHQLSDTKDSLERAESERTEHESRLRVSQQHLAKKVREAALLSERNEELKLHSQEIEHALESAKNKLYEAQASLDTHAKHQKTLQDQYQENLKTVESQSAKWEAKYFEMQEKWQEAERSHRELKRLEERFSKLQQALAHLNSILGPTLAANSIELSHGDLAFPAHKKSEEMHIPYVSTIQTSLFEAPKQQPARYKETLFG